MNDEWYTIDDFPIYMISDHGRIHNVLTGRDMAVRTNAQGFVQVNLTRDGGSHTRSVALMVARAFLDPPFNDAYNSIIHLDGDRSNCKATNLMWRPRWFAMKYHKQFSQEPYKMAVYLTDTDEVFDTIREACVKYGLLEKQIFLDTWNMKGVWPYGWVFREYKE